MNYRRENGMILIIVLGFMLIVVIAATAFMLMSSSEIQMVRTQNDSTRAFYIAEGGLQRVKFDLNQDSDWSDGSINGVSYNTADVDSDGFYLLSYSSAAKTALGGSFTIRLKDISGSTDEIWVKSKGVYNNAARTIQAKVKAIGNFGGLPVTSAMEAEGTVDVSGHATVTGTVRDNVNTTISTAASAGATEISLTDASDFIETDTIVIDRTTGAEETAKISDIDGNTITLTGATTYDHEAGDTINRILSFEEIFGKTKAEVESIAQAYSPDHTKYYTTAFSDDVAEGLTWVSAPAGTESQIASNTWSGSGILIVEGDLRITGGSFNGIIWTMGTLHIGGGATISGAIFAESGVTADTTVLGDATISYSYDYVDDAFDALDEIPLILNWREVQ